MEFNTDGPFLAFKLTEEEELATLASPHLLAYLNNKKAVYADAFLQGGFGVDTSKPIDPVSVSMRIIDQQGKYAMLLELINECEQAAVRLEELQNAAAQDEMFSQPESTPKGF